MRGSCPPQAKSETTRLDTQETSEENRWRRSERLSLSEVEPVVIPVELMQLAELSMFDIFSLFSDDLLDLLVEQTNLYATRDKNVHYFKTDRIEMRKFLGLIVVSGYHHLPTENDYWSTADELSAPFFASIISRDRFKLIKRYLHIADNSNLAQSKMAKVLPLYDRLKENCLQYGIFHQFLSIDESMVTYRGLHNA